MRRKGKQASRVRLELTGFQFHGHPTRFIRGRIRESRAGDFAGADNCFRGHALVKEHPVAGSHGVQMPARGKISHAGPSRLLVADKVGPRVRVRFRLHEPVLRCHAAMGLVRCTEMEPTEAEKLKAHRVQLLLYVLMAVMIGLPLALFLLKSLR